MSYGFMAINANGIVQIDDNFSNYYVYSRNTVGGSSVNIVLPNIAGLKILINNDNNTRDFYLIGSVIGNNTVILNWTILAGTPTINYIILAPSHFAPSQDTSYGLNVYTPSGTLAFSSNLNYLNILTEINADYNQVDPQTPTPRRTYVLPGTIGAYYIDVTPTSYLCWEELFNIATLTNFYGTFRPTVSLNSGSLETYIATHNVNSDRNFASNPVGAFGYSSGNFRNILIASE
jgi:hypothetical protein